MTCTASTVQSNKEQKEAMAININYNNQPLKKHHNPANYLDPKSTAESLIFYIS